MYASRFELAIPLGMDRRLSSAKHITWDDVANRSVHSIFVQLHDKLTRDSVGIFPIQSCTKNDELVLKRSMITLKLAIALRAIVARAHAYHITEANEGLQVSRDELRAIVADDSRLSLRIKIVCSLSDCFEVDLFHHRADIPVYGHARVSIQDGIAKVERFPNIQLTTIDIPILVRLVGFVKTVPLLAGLVT